MTKLLIAAVLTAAGTVLAVSLVDSAADAPPTTITYKQFRESSSYVDRVVAGESFILTRNGAVCCLVSPHEEEPPPPTTTTPTTTTPPPPSGDSFPSISDAEAERDGDFDTGCQLFGGDGGWQTDNIGSDRPGTGAIDRTRVVEGECSAHLSASGQHRTEVAWSGVEASGGVTWEGAWYVPSSSGYLGFMAQSKQGGSAGGCANGGISNREGSQLEVTTRASCSADNTRDPIGTYPRDQWFAVRLFWKAGNAGEVAAWVDPDATGPAPYELRLPTVTRDTQTGDQTTVKFRQGSYGEAPVDFWIDGYRLNLP